MRRRRVSRYVTVSRPACQWTDLRSPA